MMPTKKGDHMAERVILVDDLDGNDSEDVARREFQVLGGTYSIDLSEDNYKRLSEALATVDEFVEKAREVKPASKPRGASTPPAKVKGYTNTDVRDWAKNKGLEVSERGKIADDIYTAFIEDHPDAKPE